MFTPYELGSVGVLISYLFVASAFIFGVAFHRERAVFPAFIIGMIVRTMTWYAVRCPHCGKPLMKTYWASEQDFGGFGYARRAWPERVCSSCRTPLDILKDGHD